MWNLVFLFTGLLFIILLLIIFLSKPKIKSKENRIFLTLSFVNLFGFIIEIMLQIFVRKCGIDYFLVTPLSKIYLIYIYCWFTVFSIYTFLVSKTSENINEDNYKLIKYMHITVIILGIIGIMIMPIKKYYFNGDMYSYGMSVDFLKIVLGIYIIIWIIRLLCNFKTIKEKKYYPIIITILMLFVNIIIQSINPTVLIATFTMTFTCYILFFTIENPDIKMMKDLAFANELVEESKNRTLGVLNDLSKDLQGSLSKLQTFGYKKVNYKDNEEVTDELKYIKNYCIGFVDRVSGLIEIGKLESGILEEKSRNYETLELFSEIEKLFNYEKGHKKINLFIDFDKDVPMVLYGNSSKIKQLILVLFEYLVKYIKNGNLEIRIEAINVGRFCKLKFHFINYNINSKIFDNVDDIFNKKINRLISFTSSDIDIINNELVLSFNERIIDPYLLLEEDKENKGINVKYFDMSKRNILIVSNNNSNLKKILLLLKPYNSNIDVVNSFYEFRDILSDNKTYDLILIDEEINDIESNIRLLKKFANYTLNVVIMTSEMDKNNLNNYLENGYDDYIIKPINKQNINNILVKIIKNK